MSSDRPLPRYLVDFCVHDNRTGREIVSRCFYTDVLWATADALREAADAIDAGDTAMPESERTREDMVDSGATGESLTLERDR